MLKKSQSKILSLNDDDLMIYLKKGMYREIFNENGNDVENLTGEEDDLKSLENKK